MCFSSIAAVCSSDWLVSFFFNCCCLWSLSTWRNSCGGFCYLFIAAIARRPIPLLCGFSAWLAWRLFVLNGLFVLQFSLRVLGTGHSWFVSYLSFCPATVADSVPRQLATCSRGMLFYSVWAIWSFFTIILFLRISLCLVFCFVLVWKPCHIWFLS